MTQLYVIGHVNPDTDSIASAIGYAWLLRERDNVDAIPARAGAVNTQTSWVLKFLNLETPVLVTDASPRFSSVTRRLDTVSPDSPLREAWVLANRTGGIAPVQNEDGTPFGMITGNSLFSLLSRLVGPHPRQQETKLSEILELPCREATDTNTPKFLTTVRIRDVINRLLREEKDEFWVVDEKGKYLGICRQRDLLNPPRLQIILVDHNEAQQSISSIDEAELIEIIDHHRLGNHSTHMPIRFSVDIVGSTSTLISERYEEVGLSAPPQIAGMMLAGILSDTLILTSPTTTERDKRAAERLWRWMVRSGGELATESVETFGKKVLTASAGLGVRSAEDVVNTDMKEYTGGSYRFAVSQVEVSDHHEITKHISTLKEALKNLRVTKGLDFSMLMVTDVVRSSSRLLFENLPPLLDDLPYPPLPDGTLLAEGVVSRKKQLLPVILGLLES